MLAVRYDRFGGIDQLYLAEIPAPQAGPGEVLVRVEAGALNPGALPALSGATYVPGRDLAGHVVALGDGVTGFAVGDAVLGWLQSWDAHAPLVAIPADQLVGKPELLSWDVAGSLYTTPMAGLGATRAVDPHDGDVVVVTGASGGVGFTAAQLAVRAGATVLGLTSAGHADVLQQHGITPVIYGDGEEQRLRAAARGRPVDAFIDAVGGRYLELAVALGVPGGRTNTVVDFRGAQEAGAKTFGTREAGGLPALRELAELAATGALSIPIGATYPLAAVKDAYRALSDRRVSGRIVLHPLDLN